jgi:hypothetical protein
MSAGAGPASRETGLSASKLSAPEIVLPGVVVLSRAFVLVLVDVGGKREGVMTKVTG